MILVSGFGEKYTNTVKHKGMPYYVESLPEVTHEQLRDRIANPTNVPKSESQWVLCSNYQSRLRDEQLEHGEFSMIWADMDTLDASFDMETLSFYIESIAPGTQCFLHTTSSWSAKKPKYRALFLLDECIDSKTWITAQKSLSRIFKAAGVKLDNVTTRVQQPCYLPNVDPSNDLANYQYRIFEGKRDIDWLREEMVVVAEIEKEEKRLAEESATLRAAEIALYGDDARKPKEVKLFNSVTDLAELMLSVGYTQRSSRPDSEGFMHYRSPNQDGSSYATRIYPGSGRWSSRSSSDSEIGTWNGEDASGDASDIHTYFKLGGNEKKFREWVKHNVLDEEGYTLAQLEAMKMFEAVTKAKEPVPEIPEVVDVMTARERYRSCGPIDGGSIGVDDIDADHVRKTWMGKRLGMLNDNFFWWTGFEWEPVGENWLTNMTYQSLKGGEKSKSHRQCKEIARGIMSDVEKDNSYEECDPIEYRVLFRNCVYNLATDELEPHHYSNLNTHTLKVDYKHDVETNGEWDKFVKNAFTENGVFDEDRHDLLQEMMGWCLTRHDLGIQKAMLLMGVPRSGKSTIAKILKKMMSRSAGTFSFSQLHDSKMVNNLHRYDVAIDGEAGSPSSGNQESVGVTFKEITAFGDLSVSQLYTNESKELTMSCKLMMMANKVPHCYDSTGGIASRWMVCNFNNGHEGKEDRGLMLRLYKDIDHITKWALEGTKRLYRTGRFTMPEMSRVEIENIGSAASPIKQFIEDCLDVDTDGKCHKVNLINCYTMWCQENQEKPVPNGLFMSNLENELRGKGGRVKKSVRIDGRVTAGMTGVRIRTKTPTVLQAVK